jgi:hypothetical protein
MGSHESRKEAFFVGCENRLDNFFDHISLDLRKISIRVAHRLEV